MIWQLFLQKCNYRAILRPFAPQEKAVCNSSKRYQCCPLKLIYDVSKRWKSWIHDIHQQWRQSRHQWQWAPCLWSRELHFELRVICSCLGQQVTQERSQSNQLYHVTSRQIHAALSAVSRHGKCIFRLLCIHWTLFSNLCIFQMSWQYKNYWGRKRNLYKP